MGERGKLRPTHEAYEACERSIHLSPAGRDPYFCRAAVLKLLDVDGSRTAEVKATYELALRLHPACARCMHGRLTHMHGPAVLSQPIEVVREAIKQYEKMIAIEPDKPVG